METKPLISIIIPVYNGANFVKEAIDSALNQSYSNKEVIVVNDGSTDDGETKKAVEPYLDKVSYYEKENGGVSTAINYGVKHAKGDYIAWLSHDDLYSPNKLENQINALEKLTGNKVVTYGEGRFISKEGKKERKSIFSVSRHKTFKGVLSFFPFNVCVASILFPKVFLEEHPFNEESRFNQDIQIFYTLLKEGYEFHYVKDAIYYGRNHEKRVSVLRQDLYDVDAEAFHHILMNDISEKRNINFAKKYYVFLSAKKEKYPVYKAHRLEVRDYLKEMKSFGLIIRIKGGYNSFKGKVGYSLRKLLLGR